MNEYKRLQNSILILILIFTFLGCKENINPSGRKDIVGQWLWVHTTGGLAGVNIKPGKGEKQVYNFKKNKTYDYSENGTVRAGGVYDMIKAKSGLFNQDVDFIILNPNTNIELRFMYQIEDHHLYLADDYYDGFSYEYVRLK